MAKLKRLKLELRDWNWNVVGDIHANLSTARTRFADFQAVHSVDGYTLSNLEQEAKLIMDMEQILDSEYFLLAQKSRSKRLLDGDRNSDFFHRSNRSTKAKQNIGVLTIDGTFTQQQADIGRAFEKYFKKLFSMNCGVNDYSWLDIVHLHIIDDDSNMTLVAHATSD